MKMKKYICLFLALLFMLPLVSCSMVAYETNFTGVFDTFVQIYAYADSKAQFEELTQNAADILTEYHRLYDIYNDYSGLNNIKTINDNAGIAPVEVDERIIELLKFCKEAYYLTDGSVNVAMGSVLRPWHDARLSASESAYVSVPDMSELQEAAKHIDIENIIIDEELSTVYISDEKTILDVGAVAKGYATEMVCRYLIENGLDSGFVSVGGNVKILGEPKEKLKKSWNIGIQNPDVTQSGPIAVVKATEGSLATSGDYQRYFTVDGVKYHHIIDKDTLMPAEGMHGVSVWVRDSGLADVLSTYFFTISYEEALDFIAKHPELDINAYWITDKDKIYYTDSLKDHLQE